jgi:hypothetical protein
VNPLRRLYRALVPKPVRESVRTWRTLSRDLGHFRSLREGACVTRDGSPLPWYTYAAIDYLEQLDLGDARVLEFGSGNSTRYWAARSAKLVSIEDNPAWYDKVRPQLPPGVDYLLVSGAEGYVGAGTRYPDLFDVIAIDGNYRLECARAAPALLRPGGFIILDNSDWHERSAAALLASGLLHVSMAGFGPILPHVWTTSFYFSRDARLRPRHERHPRHAVGSHRRVEAQQRGEQD